VHLAISNVKHEKHYFSTARHFGCKYVTQQDMGKSPEITAPTRNISVFRNPLISPIRKWVNLEKNFPARRSRTIFLVKLSIQEHQAEGAPTQLTRSFARIQESPSMHIVDIRLQ
jgi:hypothetical protein